MPLPRNCIISIIWPTNLRGGDYLFPVIFSLSNNFQSDSKSSTEWRLSDRVIRILPVICQGTALYVCLDAKREIYKLKIIEDTNHGGVFLCSISMVLSCRDTMALESYHDLHDFYKDTGSSKSLISTRFTATTFICTWDNHWAISKTTMFQCEIPFHSSILMIKADVSPPYPFPFSLLILYRYYGNALKCTRGRKAQLTKEFCFELNQFCAVLSVVVCCLFINFSNVWIP